MSFLSEFAEPQNEILLNLHAHNLPFNTGLAEEC